MKKQPSRILTIKIDEGMLAIIRRALEHYDETLDTYMTAPSAESMTWRTEHLDAVRATLQHLPQRSTCSLHEASTARTTDRQCCRFHRMGGCLVFSCGNDAPITDPSCGCTATEPCA